MNKENKALDKKQNKKQNKRAPNVRTFARPLSNELTFMGNNNKSDVYYDNIGTDLFLSDSDPNGSYTGITRDGDNRPVQDVDDL